MIKPNRASRFLWFALVFRKGNVFMKKDEYIKGIQTLLGTCSEKTTATWIEFAEECVGSKQYAYFKELPKNEAVESWLDYQYAELYFVKKEFGADIARDILNMANLPDHPHCLYPNEMQEAAKYFKLKYTPEQMVELSVDDGCLVSDKKSRTMQDVQRDISKKQNRDSQGR